MNLNNLKHEADKIRLTSLEKSAMRARIFEKGPVLTRSPYVFMSYHLRMSLAGLLLFVLTGTGTVSAAQSALPGDLLYPVKVSINEKVEMALAPTPAAKAQVQVKLAERRVDEALELASHGRLDKKTAETLTVDFDEHSAQAVALSEPEEQDEQNVEGDPVQATIMISNTASKAEFAPVAPEREKPSVNKSGGRRDSIRESLRVKGEILKEIKIRSSKEELQIGD